MNTWVAILIGFVLGAIFGGKVLAGVKTLAQFVNVKLPNLGQLWTLAAKYGGLAVAALGANTHNFRDLSWGSVVALVVHLLDSGLNSKKGEAPSV